MVTTRSKTVAQLTKSQPKTLKKLITQGERAEKALIKQEMTPPKSVKSPAKSAKKSPAKGKGKRAYKGMPGWNKAWSKMSQPSIGANSVLKRPGLKFSNYRVTQPVRGGAPIHYTVNTGCEDIQLVQKVKGATYGVPVKCSGKGCPGGARTVRVGGKRGAHANTAATRYDAQRKAMAFAKRHKTVKACNLPPHKFFPPIKNQKLFTAHGIAPAYFRAEHTGAKGRIARAKKSMEDKIEKADEYARMRKQIIENTNIDRKAKGQKPLKATKSSVDKQATAKKQKARAHFAQVKANYA